MRVALERNKRNYCKPFWANLRPTHRGAAACISTDCSAPVKSAAPDQGKRRTACVYARIAALRFFPGTLVLEFYIAFRRPRNLWIVLRQAL